MVLRFWIEARVVENVVEPAGFLAVQGRYENHLGNLEGVLELDEVDVLRFLVLDGRGDVGFEFFDDLESLVQAGRGAHDAAVRSTSDRTLRLLYEAIHDSSAEQINQVYDYLLFLKEKENKGE